ncbi:hypothetical protein C7444_101320 [Sphaerotilus hippei]|uniref:Alpha/beta hydrolase n=1 Tax=Sphaerotilus hippei TaxID=744406 RepID=A0A318H686_9BURK|nr:alpha/beta hydrolase [Sphaerotilus hippei]PXW99490.1 hypothetical protein C7444_101320 [Sphaerotilus hippei]
MNKSVETWHVLVLPGWQDSGAQHWQSRWVLRHGYERVEQDDWLWPRRGDWMARLDEAVLARPVGQPLALVAHSLGCQLVAAWAEHSRHAQRVHAALLVAPPDTEREDMPPQLHNWRPMRRSPLPFEALALLSSDDPYATPERAVDLCRSWGAGHEVVGALGHLNDHSGLGDWDEGHQRLLRLLGRSRTIA